MGTASVVAYIGCLMVAGAVGNVFVIYVFGFKYRSSAFNVLITSLGLYDFLSCVIHMPLDILGTLQPDLLPFSILCKSACFLIALTVFSASIILFTIAVLRYRGVSRPLGRTLRPKEAKFIGFLTLIPSLCLSWPALVMFENKTIESESGITIHMCGIHNQNFTLYSIVYHILLLSLFLANLITLATLYGLLSKFLINRRRVFSEVIKRNRSMAISSVMKSQNDNERQNFTGIKQNSHSVDHSDEKSLETKPGVSKEETFPLWIKEQESTVKPVSVDVTGTNSETVKTNTDMFLVLPNNTASQVRTNAVEIVSVCEKQSKKVKIGTLRVDNQSSRPQRNNNNGILMMLLVTVVFCISYMPHLTYAMLFIFSDKETVISMSLSAITGILFRSFYLNNVANPVIYALCSGDFRTEVGKIFMRQK